MVRDISQDQNQDVRFQEKPVNKVRCHFFKNTYIEKMQHEMSQLMVTFPNSIALGKLIEREQQIDIVVLEGKVTKVICPLLEDENCSSSENKGKTCYLKT